MRSPATLARFIEDRNEEEFLDYALGNTEHTRGCTLAPTHDSTLTGMKGSSVMALCPETGIQAAARGVASTLMKG